MYKVLDRIEDTFDLKRLDKEELIDLCSDIRSFLVDNVSKTGGHLAPNLGVVELTVALHYVFDSPNDKIIFDVGHQCYVHKILTGRKDKFNTLRQMDGLSGFPKTYESRHDIFSTGHSSTSIASAIGIATANKLDGKKDYTIAVIGDGSMTGGLAFEALNNANIDGTNLIVVLNDNRKNNPQLENEHGLSLYIEVDGYKILLDAGQTDIFKKNAKKLGVNLDDLDTIVLSHGHYDHGNGLKHIDKKIPLICCPGCDCYRVSKRTGNYGGLNQKIEELSEKFDLIQTTEPYKITENIFFLGQIERKTDFETKSFPMTKEDGTDDAAIDDTGIAIKTSKGLIVISGCAHSGICNTVEFAKKITGERNILAVIGGFHLKNVDESTLETISYMQNNNVQGVYLAHCTSDEVCQEFEKRMPYRATTMKVGEEYLLDQKQVEREI